MPLAFRSLSHGNLSFGFFNIESDMLLLGNYFFFSTAFCHHLSWLAGKSNITPSIDLFPAYIIDKPDDVGNLMDAIGGIRFTGFIGDVYRQFPFPDNPRFFKQNPTCARTQNVMKQLISQYARPVDIVLDDMADGDEITIGDYRFGRPVFHQMVEYVWLGGYPRWKGGMRPHYVQSIKTVLSKSQRDLFAGLYLNE